METTTYEQQALELANKLGVILIVESKTKKKHFSDDEEMRDVYKLTLKRGEKSYTFDFGQSLTQSDHFEVKIKKNVDNWQTYGGYGPQLFSHKEKADRVIDAIIQKRKDKGEIKALTNLTKYKKDNFRIVEVKGEKPTMYDVLTCLTKYEPGTHEDFCSEYGYDTDSRKAYKTYLAVCEEWQHMQSMFNDEELELLYEIQ